MDKACVSHTFYAVCSREALEVMCILKQYTADENKKKGCREFEGKMARELCSSWIGFKMM